MKFSVFDFVEWAYCAGAEGVIFTKTGLADPWLGLWPDFETLSNFNAVNFVTAQHSWTINLVSLKAQKRPKTCFQVVIFRSCQARLNLAKLRHLATLDRAGQDVISHPHNVLSLSRLFHTTVCHLTRYPSVRETREGYACTPPVCAALHRLPPISPTWPLALPPTGTTAAHVNKRGQSLGQVKMRLMPGGVHSCSTDFLIGPTLKKIKFVFLL